MPAAASAAASSPPRPNTKGSPPLRRTTTFPAPASLSLPRHSVYKLPPASSFASGTFDGGAVLTQTASGQVLSQVNAARTKMSGINKHALPAGLVTVHPDGHLTLVASGGRRFNLRPDGTLASLSRAPAGIAPAATSVPLGSVAKFAPSGRLRSLRTRNLDIQYGPHGSRTVVKRLPDQASLVSYGPHSGYLQRTIVQNNATSVQRTYVTQNATYVRTYTPYSYRGVTLLTYVPPYYYSPAFYGWVYYPWPTPVSFKWGWRGYPWHGIYRVYFIPMPLYPSPVLWMTDYILASTLADGYDQQQDYSDDPNAAAPVTMPNDDDSSDQEIYAQTSTPITPALRAEIAAEVQQDLTAENAAATYQASPDAQPSSPAQQLSLDLQPDRVFLVSSLLTVSLGAGTCSLTAGDILQVVDPSGSNPRLTALLSVASSKRGDCPAGAQVELYLQDLQDMDNYLRAQTDDALAKLHSTQGQQGLPAAPQPALAPPTPSSTDNAAPTPDPGVASMLAEAQQQASQEETNLLQSAFASNPPTNAPANTATNQEEQ